MRRRMIVAVTALAAIAGAVLWGSSGGNEFPAELPHVTAAPAPPGLPAAWRPAFVADFSGSELRTSVWSTCYPWQEQPSGCTNFGNPEYEWYLPSQVRQSGGILHLVAQHVPTQGQTADGGAKQYSCRSGMVTTYPGFRFEYGYVQVVVRLPDGPGLWPAFWLLASDLKWPPEIDIFEHWSNIDYVRVGLHPPGATDNFSYSAKPPTADLAVGWHTFGLSWTATKLTWFIDGKAVATFTKGIPRQLMYIVADLAQSSSPTPSGGQCSGTMLIRSVEVWRP